MAVFSFAAFTIVVRETVEAALIVSILLAYLAKTDNKKYQKDIWTGTGLALLASAILGGTLLIVFNGLSDTNLAIFEGVVMLAAASVLMYMIIWMRVHAKKIKTELQNAVTQAIDTNKRWSLILLPFAAVFREGVETVLFLAGVYAQPNETMSSIIFGSSVGLIVAMALAVAIFNGAVRFDLKLFFDISAALLFVLALFLVRTGIHEFQEVGFLGGETVMGTLIQLIGIATFLVVLTVFYRRVNRSEILQPTPITTA